MIEITQKTKHPISMYSYLYSPSEEGFISENEETYKGLQQVCHIVDENKATIIMDCDYDNVKIMGKILNQHDNFVIRLKKNHHLLYQNKKLSVRELALRRKGKIKFLTEIKGIVYDLNVSHIEVEIPSLKEQKFTLVVVCGYGKDLLVLITNKKVKKRTKSFLSLKKLNFILSVVMAIISYMSLQVEK